MVQEMFSMQINVTGRHLILTPTIEEYARKKARKLPRFFNRIQQVEILIDKAKNGFDVEIITDVAHHQPFVATSSDHDLYACIDDGIDKVVRQLSDHKKRLRNNKHPHDAVTQEHAE